MGPLAHNIRSKGWFIVTGGVMSGLSIATLGLVGALGGSFALALVLRCVTGICHTTYATAIQSSLQMLVPDRMLGHVMGFSEITYNIMPLAGMLVNVLAHLITAPLTIAVGGLAVAAFAVGPAMVNREVRHLRAQLRQAETAEASGMQRQQPSPSPPDN